MRFSNAGGTTRFLSALFCRQRTLPTTAPGIRPGGVPPQKRFFRYAPISGASGFTSGPK